LWEATERRFVAAVIPERDHPRAPVQKSGTAPAFVSPEIGTPSLTKAA